MLEAIGTLDPPPWLLGGCIDDILATILLITVVEDIPGKGIVPIVAALSGRATSLSNAQFAGPPP